MLKQELAEKVEKLFHLEKGFAKKINYHANDSVSEHEDQAQTNEVFGEKWIKYNSSEERENLYQLQRDWYLTLYGFENENQLAEFLRKQPVIFDAGCGLGYKAAWFAELAPESLVIGMDYSDAVVCAAENYRHLPNLFFIKGDIASTGLPDEEIDYVSCDQVIMHTEYPEMTFKELTRVTRKNGQFACYFYAKKALPRELLDDYFRSHCKNLSTKDIWEMSHQLTELGRVLSELNVKFVAPDIPQLGIKGGEYDIQRFIYWNFLKCFWSPQLGKETSDATNFDWYSPSNARRFDQNEVMGLVRDNSLTVAHFHSEPACWSGRFVKC